MSDTASGDGKTIAIISYITLIGWIVALVMHNNDKTDFGAFHIRQSLGIICVAIALSIINAVAGVPLLGWIIQLAIIVFWILGFIGAVQGEKKPVPVLGEQFQQWFKGIG